MIYEGRFVSVIRGRDDEWKIRVLTKFLPIMKKHGGTPIGAYQTVIGNTQDYYIVIGFDSVTHREKVYESMGNDPEWQKIEAKWNKQATVANLSISIMKPVSLPDINE
ncbi:MAG: NIPSNAP family protein [Dehalococcoidia bacterium]|nr:MAG: NIPSNAP family protein [Dehalococcoidia bacterium]